MWPDCVAKWGGELGNALSGNAIKIPTTVLILSKNQRMEIGGQPAVSTTVFLPLVGAFMSNA